MAAFGELRRRITLSDQLSSPNLRDLLSFRGNGDQSPPPSTAINRSETTLTLAAVLATDKSSESATLMTPAPTTSASPSRRTLLDILGGQDLVSGVTVSRGGGGGWRALRDLLSCSRPATAGPISGLRNIIDEREEVARTPAYVSSPGSRWRDAVIISSGEGATTSAEEEEEQQQQQPGRVSLMVLLEEADRNNRANVSLQTALTAAAAEEEREKEEELLEDEERGSLVEIEKEKNNWVCCVCMVRQKGAAFISCGHTFCRACAREVWNSRATCPLCNATILDILDIF